MWFNPLNGKKILFCRAREKSANFEKVFRQAGASVKFLSVYRNELIRGEIARDAIVETLKQIPGYDWLVFSSAYGVEALLQWLTITGMSGRSLSLNRIRTGIVGKKTLKLLQERFYKVNILLQGDNLQELLNKISQSPEPGSGNVLHLTSLQSLIHLQPDVPAPLTLVRQPIYQTVLNDAITRAELAEVQNQRFDVVLFGSPSAFAYFRQLFRDNTWLRNTQIATLGKTTAGYIKKQGFKVKIVPERPDAESLFFSIIKGMTEL